LPFDRKSESWKVGNMKTTLDLPPDLVREMKLRAAGEGRKLRDVATEVFRRGLERSTPAAASVRRRVKLPLVRCKQVSTEMSAANVAKVLLTQEMDWSRETTGR